MNGPLAALSVRSTEQTCSDRNKCVSANTVATCWSEPLDHDFELMAYEVSPSISGFFVVVAIGVEDTDQRAPLIGGICADHFDIARSGYDKLFPLRVPKGKRVFVEVENIDGAPHRFHSVAWLNRCPPGGSR